MVDEAGKYTLSDYTKLKQAIGSGILEVEFDGPDGERRIRYQSIDKMRKVLHTMAVELGLCKPRGRTNITSDKGYC